MASPAAARLDAMLQGLEPQATLATSESLGFAAARVSAAAEPPVPLEVLAGLKDFDSPTIFNAVEKVLMKQNGGVHPQPEDLYTDHTIVNLTPDFDTFIGFAVTVTVTTNDGPKPTSNTFAPYCTSAATCSRGVQLRLLH